MNNKIKISQYTKHIKEKTKIKNDDDYDSYLLNLNHKFYKKLLMIEKRCDNQNQLNEYLNYIKFKSDFKNLFINNLLDFECVIQKTWCSSNYYIREFYEYNNQNLNLIFKNMKLNNKIFNKEDLNHLLYQQIISNCFLEKNNFFNANISLDNILIDQKDGISKSQQFNVFPISYNNSNNLRMYVEKNKKFYCSPSTFNIITQSLSTKYDNLKESVFNFGLAFLELALMEDINLIDFNEYKYDTNKLNYYIKKLKNIQNNVWVHAVSMMLKQDEESRPTFTQIFKELPNFSDYNKSQYSTNNSKTNLVENKDNLNESYKNNPDYEIYFDDTYNMYYYYNIKTKECDWIYDKKENKDNLYE